MGKRERRLVVLIDEQLWTQLSEEAAASTTPLRQRVSVSDVARAKLARPLHADARVRRGAVGGQ